MLRLFVTWVLQCAAHT